MEEEVKKFTIYSTSPIGILFTGSSESELSLRMVPTAFAIAYMTFDRPEPWLAQENSTNG